MFKKVFSILILLVSTVLLAQPNRAEVISAIKSNPAILNTPQAQMEMQKAGVDRQTVLDKVNSLNSTNTNNSENIQDSSEVSNDIVIEENIKNDINKKGDTKKSSYINPFEYQNNNKVLTQLATKQSIKIDKELNRFGVEFFKNKNSLNSNSLSVPDYYILNNGDIISIWIYGTIEKQLSLKIDNNGNINIPKLGPVNVVGKQFIEIKKKLEKMLNKTYPTSETQVNIEKYSTVQVNLVGDVKAPGLYNINALSTVKDLLIKANGIKENGSLRNIIIKRDNKVIGVIDFYKLLQQGDSILNIILRSNDIVFIPKANKIVSIGGYISNPAKYELQNSETLLDLIKFSGGLKSDGSKYGFLVKRFIDNKLIKTIEVDFKNASNFKLTNNDYIHVYKIDKVHNQSIYMYGNVVRPGEKELLQSNSLKLLFQAQIKKFGLKGVFLDNTLFDYALIKRQTNNLSTKILRFNLGDIIDNSNNKDVKLFNDDKIYIFNKYNSSIVPYVTIKGVISKEEREKILKEEKLKLEKQKNIKSEDEEIKLEEEKEDINTLDKEIGGYKKYNYYKNMSVKDIINIAGYNKTIGNKPYSKIKVTTYDSKTLMPKILLVDENYILEPFDQVELFDYYYDNKIETFSIQGEVNLPNSYSLNKDMTLLDAVEISGGFTHKAYKNRFEVVRYTVTNNDRKRDIIDINLEQAQNFILKDSDEVTIFRIPNWYDRKVITLKGEVKFPGTYTIRTGEKLSSVIKRAGGFTQEAFTEGAIFTREQLKINEKQRMDESIAKLKQQITFLSTNGREVGAKESSSSELVSTIKMLEQQAKDYKALGRLVVYLDKDVEKFKNSAYDLRLQDKDTLIVPGFNDTISVYGEVMNPSSFVFDEKLNSTNYLELAGGLSQRADNESIYMILANGEAKKLTKGYFYDDFNQPISRGSSIIVPMEINRVSNVLMWKEVSQIVYQLAITAASLNTVGAI